MQGQDSCLVGCKAQLFGTESQCYCYLVSYLYFSPYGRSFGLNLQEIRFQRAEQCNYRDIWVYLLLLGAFLLWVEELIQWAWAIFHILVVTLQAYIFMVLNGGLL